MVNSPDAAMYNFTNVGTLMIKVSSFKTVDYSWSWLCHRTAGGRVRHGHAVVLRAGGGAARAAGGLRAVQPRLLQLDPPRLLRRGPVRAPRPAPRRRRRRALQGDLPGMLRGLVQSCN